MTTEIEDQLIAGMREEVGDITLTSDVLANAARCHRRRLAVQRTAYAAGVAGLAGALVAVLAVGGGRGGPGVADPARDRGEPVAAAPNLKLAAAVAASENISFRFKITRNDPNGQVQFATLEGAYDPAAKTGYLNVSYPGEPVVTHERLINGVLYLVPDPGSKNWRQRPGPGRLTFLGPASGRSAGATADPAELLKALRQDGAKITQTGARTYHFEVTRPAHPGTDAGVLTLAGDVTIDADGRVGKVAFTETHKFERRSGQTGPQAGATPASEGPSRPEDRARDEVYGSKSEVTVELSGYGLPVQVEKPTEVIMDR
jgi:hypothetical protein